MVFCTCPDRTTAEQLATGLVAERLAACVNLHADVTSVYRWNDEVLQEPEALMMIKTTSARYSALQAWLQHRHPYDVPEIIAVPITAGAAPYLDWVNSCTSHTG